MVAQVVLNEKQSTYGGPYGYYTVTLTPSARTKDSVKVLCSVTAHLAYSDSNTQYGVTCGLYIGGAWREFTLVPYGTWWEGTSPISTSATFTVGGLSVTQTSITGIQFRAIDGASPYEGPSLSATACSNLAIDMFGGVAHINVDGAQKEAIPWVNVDGTWKQAIPWVNADGTWKVSV